LTYQIVSERKAPEYKISNPGDVYKALARYGNARNERFIVITLNGGHQVIATRIVSMGLVNRTIVHPREVFWNAIKDNAVGIVVAHNHPSGNLDPSQEDLDITRRLSEAGSILGISLLDHVIFHKKGFYSFVEHGLLSSAQMG